jgi:hypothetical protein
LLTIEQSPDASTSRIDVDGASAEQIAHHLSVLADYGFVRVHDLSSVRVKRFIVELTANGHDFLDTVRREEVWDRVRRIGPVPLDMLRELASEVLMQTIRDQRLTAS